MSIRLVVGLACLLSACSESGGGGDVASSWFGLMTQSGALSVAQTGHYEFRSRSTDERSIKLASGQLESPVLDQLKALLTQELINHYRANRTTDEQRCRDEGGYSLVHFGGCWIVDEVTDEKTKHMLDVLVSLYKEKEADALSAPDAPDSDASAPTTPRTELGTPHI